MYKYSKCIILFKVQRAMKSFVLWSIFCLLPLFVNGLDNGLALTPPMGWLSWERFRCNIDCKNDPENCISENLFKAMADEMVVQGFKDAGYEYVIIDDCWLSHERDAYGNLQADPERFPSGIKALADYIHKLGLKFGIYEDYGTHTCGGYPGVIDHMKQDAELFASWDVDYVKLDGCYAEPSTMDAGYPEFGMHLNSTGRPMVYSCSWPAYQKNPNYTSIPQFCNLWRNYDDIEDSYESLMSIIDRYGEIQDVIQPIAGPGRWNDPDMLIIGDYSLSIDQSLTQMAMWAVLASPLIMSNDLRTLRPEFREILLNADVIRINQDTEGIQGKRIFHDKNVDIYVRSILPKQDGYYSAAVGITYRGVYGTPVKITLNPKALGLDYLGGYIAHDVFSSTSMGSMTIDTSFNISINPNGARLLRFNVKLNKMRIDAKNPVFLKMKKAPKILLIHEQPTKKKISKIEITNEM